MTEQDKGMWTRYSLALHVGRLGGGIPRNPELIKRWQEARWPEKPEKKLRQGDPQTPVDAAMRTIEGMGDQLFTEAQVEEITGQWTGFMSRNGSLQFEGRCVNAMLKECANIVKSLVKVNGKPPTALKAKIAERCFVEEDMISLHVSEPSASPERPIHVMTRQGQRDALKRTDEVHDVDVRCTLRVLNDGMITESILRKILDHGVWNGLGADRSQGLGRFTYELTEIEPA